jgi:hypothetical protein
MAESRWQLHAPKKRRWRIRSYDEKSRQAMLRGVLTMSAWQRHAEERARRRSKDAEERARHH